MLVVLEWWQSWQWSLLDVWQLRVFFGVFVGLKMLCLKVSTCFNLGLRITTYFVMFSSQFAIVFVEEITC